MAVIKWARAASYNKANTYPGANGEIVIDIEQNRLFLYDGANAYVSNTFFQSNVYISSGAASFDWANTPTEKIVRSDDIGSGDRFGGGGAGFSNDSNYAVIGAWYEGAKGAAYIFTRSGSTWTQQAKLVSSTLAANDQFGWAVDISNDASYALVGARIDDDGGNASGSAFVFLRSGSTWAQQAKLTASDAAADDYFGYNVAISGDGNYALVGAIGESSSAGAAYVFLRTGTTWAQQAKLTASDAAASDSFGWDVSISDDGTYALIGAYQNDDDGNASGSAYVFLRTGTSWAQQTKITADDAAATDYFGAAVDLNSDATYAVVGAYSDSLVVGAATYGLAGSAYIFTRSGTTWTQQAKVRPDDLAAGDRFGIDVSINNAGSLIVAGSERADSGGAGDTGAAYIFERDGTSWSQAAKLLASDAQASDKFGKKVEISDTGQFAFAGAADEDGGAGNPGAATGAAYIYEAT